MARSSLEDRFNRTLIGLGKGTLCVTIPREFLDELGWEKRHRSKSNNAQAEQDSNLYRNP